MQVSDAARKQRSSTATENRNSDTEFSGQRHLMRLLMMVDDAHVIVWNGGVLRRE